MYLICKRTSYMNIVTCEENKIFDLWSCLLRLMICLIVNIMHFFLFAIKEQNVFGRSPNESSFICMTQLKIFCCIDLK